VDVAREALLVGNPHKQRGALGAGKRREQGLEQGR